MNRSNANTALRTEARMAAFLSLFTILTGIYAQGYVSNTLAVNTDAANTAANIVAHKALWQFAYAVFIIEMSANIAMVAVFYRLLKPAGRSVSLSAAFLGLSACIVKMFSRVFFIAPLLVLGDPAYLSVFSAEQKQALALLLFRINARGTGMAVVVFGLYAILTGYLILRSNFLPKFLGWLSMVSGAGWLTFLYQPLGSSLFTFIALLAIAGALAMIVWLFVFGVDEQRWHEQAVASALPQGASV